MFNPYNWYWQADDGRIFSSVNCELVNETDGHFKKWKAAGGVATRWPADEDGEQTDASLQAVLQPYGVFVGLAAYKDAAIRRINETAENCRRKFITTGDGQMIIYIEKINQARSCLEATAPNNTDFPLLSAEVGITAPTLVGVARAVVSAYDVWLVAGSAIEAVRRAAIVAVKSSETLDAARSVYDNIVWPD